jgi:5-dehydro-4-deoxyglucarate dehydratase
VPVYAGAGGSVTQAKLFAKTAKEAGADGLLLLPPYLVEMPEAGLIAYTREVAAATDLPVIVYNRNNARYTEESAVDPDCHRIQGSPTASAATPTVAALAWPA